MRFRGIVAIFLIAFAARAAWGMIRLVTAADPAHLEFPDEQQYWQMAGSLAGGEGLRDELGFRATRMPLYPAFLALFTAAPHGVIVAKAAHWILGALVAVLAACLAADIAGRRAGIITAAIVACDPFLVFFSSLLLTETVFAVAMLLFLWASWRVASGPVERIYTRWLGAAASGILCVYLRESSLGMVLLVYGALAVAGISSQVGRRRGWRALGPPAFAVALVAVSLVPWALRNKYKVGEYVWLTTRSGISLYDGVGPAATGASDLGMIKREVAELTQWNESAWNRWFLNESRRAIRDDPGRVIRLAWTKLGRMWNPTANAAGYRGGVFAFIAPAWSIPLYILGLIGAFCMWRQRWRRRPADPRPGLALSLLMIPPLYLTILHSIFVGSVRYRLPAMPLIAILASYALTTALELIKARRPP